MILTQPYEIDGMQAVKLEEYVLTMLNMPTGSNTGMCLENSDVLTKQTRKNDALAGQSSKEHNASVAGRR